MKLFENKKQIEDFIHSSPDFEDTEKLISDFKTLQKERSEFYITITELERILKWKLGKQYGRQKEIRKRNDDETVKAVTKTAFSITHSNKEVETKLKLEILSILAGVHIPVASAILTLCFPQEYSVIDYRNWRQIYITKEKKDSYSTTEYWNYLNEIKKIAKEFNLTPQEIDLAIWQKDRTEEINNIRK